jgi:hypothetical protein
MCCQLDFTASGILTSSATAVARGSWHAAGNCSGWRWPPPADPLADYRDRFEALTGQSLRQRPHCHTGVMLVIGCNMWPQVCQLVPDTS